jgi:hypothetical protein
MAQRGNTTLVPGAGDTTIAGLSTTREAVHHDRSLIDEGAELGAEMLAVVQDNANAFFREQRDRAANEIGAFAELLHNSVRAMRPPQGIAARCADEAASQIDDFAAWLRTRSWSELTGDVEELGRRYPLSFLSAAAGVGFLAARLLTASTDRSAASQTDEPRQPAMERAPLRTAAAGEAEVVAGVAGGAAAEHGAGVPGEE